MSKIKIIPREYQKNAWVNVSNSLRENDKVVLCLPTGAGKTVTFSYICQEALKKDNGKHILILVHRSELLTQTVKTLSNFGINALSISAKFKGEIPSDIRVIVCMVETIDRRLKAGKLSDINPRVIIADECHIKSFNKVLDHFNCKVIGCTATPMYASKKNPMSSYWNDLVIGTSVNQLISEGYLCRPTLYTMPLSYEQKKQLKKSSTGDYTNESVMNIFGDGYFQIQCYNEYKRLSEGKKTLIFCMSIEHVEDTYNHFLSMDSSLKIRFYHSNVKGVDRVELVKWFEETEGAILVNCGVFTTGFDAVTLQTIILNRPIASLSLLHQIVGRGSRPHETKKGEFKIIDLGSNFIELNENGHEIPNLPEWDSAIDWNDYFNPKKKEEGVSPLKNCPECDLLVPVRTMVCLDCGYEFPKGKGEEEEKEAIKLKFLENVSVHTMSVQKIIDLSDRKNWKPFRIFYLICEKSIKKKKGDMERLVLAEQQTKLLFDTKNRFSDNYKKNKIFKKDGTFTKWCKDIFISKLKEYNNEK